MVRDEYLYNLCTGSANDNSNWTTPFTTIYNTLWEHYTFDHTFDVAVGKKVTVTDVTKHSAYGSSDAGPLSDATETLAGEVYTVTGWLSFGWVTFAWSRNERTYTDRTTTWSETNADEGGGGGS